MADVRRPFVTGLAEVGNPHPLSHFTYVGADRRLWVKLRAFLPLGLGQHSSGEQTSG